MSRVQDVIDYLSKEVKEELDKHIKSAEFWNEQHRLLAQEVMRAAGLPDDFLEHGTDAAFAKIAEFKSWYDHTFPKEG